MDVSLRCPRCQALVVDRRSSVCTTCHQALPAEWIMTPDQAAKVSAIDRAARAEHLAAMRTLNNIPDPNAPPIIRALDTYLGPY